MLVDLADGRSLPLPNGVSVSRNGNVYLIKGQDGEIVRAAISKDDFLDVNLFLGYAQRKWVRGLLGNANGRTDDDIATRDGRMIAQPVSFMPIHFSTFGASSLSRWPRALRACHRRR